MKELVLTPMGMTHSTFEQLLPAALQSQTASAHTNDGLMVPGRYRVHPEMAAAELWTTPTDLLKWAIEIAAARAGKSKVLSRQIATQMLTRQNERNGLGPEVEGTGLGFYFFHAGSNTGFRCHLIYFPETGQGAVVMMNGDQPIREIINAIAEEYQWPGHRVRKLEAISIDAGDEESHVCALPRRR